MPRALPPDADRALMAAVAALDDIFARTGLQLLRATGMRVGEMLDLELDCLINFAGHGTWLKAPLGKPGSERMAPLEPATLTVIDTWMTHRDKQRAIAHPRTSSPANFLVLEHAARPTGFRLRQGLRHAVANAGLPSPGGAPPRVTPHTRRHTFGTSLINGGISLPALMALMGHVTPKMTLRYATLAPPAIRAAYQDAIDKIRA